MNRSEVRKELVGLYQTSSKHSNYQVLPDILQSEIGKDVSVRTRYEKERLRYILDNLQVGNRTILDIGGNNLCNSRGHFIIFIFKSIKN